MEPRTEPTTQLPDSGGTAVGRLLVAIDGSDASLRALDHAIGRAIAHPHGTIHLVTAHERIVPFPDIGVVYQPFEQRLALQARESRAILEAGARRLEAAGVPYTAEVLTDPSRP